LLAYILLYVKFFTANSPFSGLIKGFSIFPQEKFAGRESFLFKERE
jgi:hypothetical protein